jgi:hypothetical protein
MRTVLNGVIVSEADARRMVAYAQRNGWLPVDAPPTDRLRREPS